MKLIIIEGPDNCGKNTLINKLSENFLTVTNTFCTAQNILVDGGEHNWFEFVFPGY